jgi:hypothetical protein
MTGTYGSYDVSISFDTSLSGGSLDNLSLDDITGTVTNFSETNTIPGFGSGTSNALISTDFDITNTAGQEVTPTSDSGQTQGTISYSPPPEDEAGFPAGTGPGDESDSGAVLFISYPAFPGENPNDFYCTYSDTTGALITDNDPGFCPGNAVQSGTPGSTVMAGGTGLFTSDPANPGAPSEVPEPASVATMGSGLAGLALAALRHRAAK